MTEGMAVLGFGCGDLFGGEQERQSLRLLEAAFDAGVRHFDVARLYGDGSAEAVVGKALGPVRDQVTLVSKAGIVPWSMRLGARIGGKAARLARKAPPLRTLVPEPPPAGPRFGAFDLKSLKHSVEVSLKALGTDQLDMLLLHECGPADVSQPEMLRFLEGLRAQGKILTYGVAARFEETLAVLAETPAMAPVVQAASDAANRNIDRLRAAGARRIITHTPLKNALPLLMVRLAREPEAAEAWRSVTGRDPTDREAAAALLLAEAAAQNPGGVVLFSTSRPERIAQAVRAVNTLPSPAERRLLQDLLDGAERRADLDRMAV